MELAQVRRCSRDSQFADHLARTHLRLFSDDRPGFLVADVLVKDLPNQGTEPISDRTDRLDVAEAREEPPLHGRGRVQL